MITPAVVATILVTWTAFGLLLSVAYSAGVIQLKNPGQPTKSIVGWITKLLINGLFIWAIIYLART